MTSHGRRKKNFAPQKTVDIQKRGAHRPVKKFFSPKFGSNRPVLALTARNLLLIPVGSVEFDTIAAINAFSHAKTPPNPTPRAQFGPVVSSVRSCGQFGRSSTSPGLRRPQLPIPQPAPPRLVRSLRLEPHPRDHPTPPPRAALKPRSRSRSPSGRPSPFSSIPVPRGHQGRS